ncbi:HPr kinase/phosphorylase [Novosphingobium sp.]|uniref:HPr kinase/phosphorylase n=1 Tax=Novosphingobium sp. TaxID=1874826 RepID=UPI002736AA1B|nr:serine kinase [Novosphingobium sp.]MDP3906948.1 serine kinase [Novosphingobium sp.]
MSLLHQASCIAIRRRAVLIEGPAGSGKSSLALALLDRGAELIGDDGVTLSVRDERLLASPPPRIAGLIEVCNVGLLTRPTVAGVPVVLVLTLDPQAPRFIEQAELAVRAGVTIPLVRLWPDSPVLHLRAELALDRYGLTAD